MLVRTMTVLFAGLALVATAFLILDIDLTRRILGGFVVLPIGAMLIGIALWSLGTRFIHGD
jgi:hypothetical protein